MLIIRHLTGPLAGEEMQVQGREEGRIVFGRDPEACDVVYPPETTKVSRRHFALVRKPSGAWTPDLFGHPYVAIDGDPADMAAPVRSGSTVRLGGDDGPSFQVTIPVEAAAAAFPQTVVQKEMKGSRAAAAQAERAALRAKRLALAGVAVALVAVTAVGGLTYVRGASERQFASDLRLLRERQERLAAESIPREHRQRVEQAAYQVLIRDANGREQWAGTSVPIGPDMLATNAHVAIVREQFEPGSKLIVRAPGAGGRTWDVVWHKLHPAYNALEAFLREDPLFVETIKSDENPWGANVLTGGNSYDVALMRVEGQLAGPVMEVAPADEVVRLGVGDPLAYAGYPSQNIVGSEVQRLGATPQVRTGLVTAMTDLFTMPAEPAYRRLVHHNLGTTAGTSGSPIIGISGRIVALHNRSTYAAGAGGAGVPIWVVAYAQRADLLLDLMSGRAESMLDVERAYWGKQTANMRRGAEVIVPVVLDSHRPHPTATATVAGRGIHSLTPAERVKLPGPAGDEQRRRRQHTFKVQAGSRHVFIAYAQKAAPISLYRVDGGRVVAQQEAGKWYPALPYEAKTDATLGVLVVGPDDDVTYTLTDFVWDAPRS